MDGQDLVPISVSEAYNLLAPLKARYKNTRSTSYQIYMKTLEYTEAFCKIDDKSALMDLKSFFTDAGVTETEGAALASLAPQSVSEAKTYVPTLSRMEEWELSRVIEKIQSIIR